MADAGERDVTGWPVVGEEPMGDPGKRWLEDPASGERWLFKPAQTQQDQRGAFARGEDWAEKIAADAARLLGLPAADVELARQADQVGAISLDVTGGQKLTPGNELLYGHDATYPASAPTGEVAEYTLERIFAALEDAEVRPPPCGGTTAQSAPSVFAAYLLFDAWIANQDRHHGNWGVLEDPLVDAPPVLAPSFDHGSSLGFQLHDDDKQHLLDSGGVDRWARRGACRPMAGQPTLVTLAARAVDLAGSPARQWLERLAAVTADQLDSLVENPGSGRLSQPSRRFAAAVLDVNRRRLLDAI